MSSAPRTRGSVSGLSQDTRDGLQMAIGLRNDPFATLGLILITGLAPDLSAGEAGVRKDSFICF